VARGGRIDRAKHRAQAAAQVVFEIGQAEVFAVTALVIAVSEQVILGAVFGQRHVHERPVLVEHVGMRVGVRFPPMRRKAQRKAEHRPAGEFRNHGQHGGSVSRLRRRHARAGGLRERKGLVAEVVSGA
jgi:hypothetical protein